MTTFGFVAIFRQAADVVTYPGGESSILERGQGPDAVTAWRRIHAEAGAVGPVSVDAAPGQLDEGELERAYAAELASWRARMESELARLERAPSSGFGTPEGRRRSYIVRHPEPTLESVRDLLNSPPQPAEAIGVAAEVGPTTRTIDDYWWVRSTAGGTNSARPLTAAGALPRDRVALVLTELAADGWAVAHITEDRAVVHVDELSTTITIAMHVLVRHDEIGQRLP